MSLIELNGLDNNSASVIMDKKDTLWGSLVCATGVTGALSGARDTLERRENENLRSRVSRPDDACFAGKEITFSIQLKMSSFTLRNATDFLDWKYCNNLVNFG